MKELTFNEALYTIISTLDTPIMRRKTSKDVKDCVNIVKNKLIKDGTWDKISSQCNSIHNDSGIEFTNRDGDKLKLVYIEPNHWRMFKEDNYYGVSMHGEDPKYIAADFVGGGPMIGKGSNIGDFIDGINERVEYIMLIDAINSIDIFTTSI